MRESTHNKSGPGRCANTTIRDLDTARTVKESQPMPYTDSSPNQAPSVYPRPFPPEPTTLLRPEGVDEPRMDGCPRCVMRGNPPLDVRWKLDGSGYYATYHCATCFHEWWTGWACEPAAVTA